MTKPTAMANLHSRLAALHGSPILEGIFDHCDNLADYQRQSTAYLRKIAVRDHPHMPHTRDPRTKVVTFADEEEVWFVLKYL